jgi:hypothetical protein
MFVELPSAERSSSVRSGIDTASMRFGPLGPLRRLHPVAPSASRLLLNELSCR